MGAQWTLGAVLLTLANLPSDFLEHLLGLEKFEDHDLGLVLVEIDLTLGDLSFEFGLLSFLLHNLPGAQTFHQLRVVVHLPQVDRTLPLEKTLQLLLHVFSSGCSFLSFKLISELPCLLHFFFALIKLLFHDKVLSLLFDSVGTIKGLELLRQIVKQSCLLFFRHFAILVRCLHLLLTLLNTSSQVSSVFIKLGLKFTLAT